MKRIIPLIAPLLVASPTHAGFIVPEVEKEYETTNMEWRGCRVPSFEGHYVSRKDIDCYRYFKDVPKNVYIRWRNAKKCEEYTDGCVQLEGIIFSNGKRYELGRATKRFRIKSTGLLSLSTTSYYEIDAWETSKSYQPMQFNCRTSISEIKFGEDYTNPDTGILYYTKQFHTEVCDNVFPELKEDFAYRLKKTACKMTTDMEKKEECFTRLEQWQKLRRWK